MRLFVQCEEFRYAETAHPALTGIAAQFNQGERVAIVGENGSGKSTFARLLNGLLTPTIGTVKVNGWDTKHKQEVASIRRHVGFVFQNPDNQLVESIVEDDIVFGLENAQLPNAEIAQRLKTVTQQFAIEPLLKREVHQLSGGQKQRVALAGVFALSPSVLVLDEVTSMLDPKGKEQVNACIDALHRDGVTIVSVTHDVEEIQQAERVLGFQNGRLIYDGSPQALFADHRKVQALQVKRPFIYELQAHLAKRAMHLPHCDSEEALIEALWTCHLSK